MLFSYKGNGVSYLVIWRCISLGFSSKQTNDKWEFFMGIYRFRCTAESQRWILNHFFGKLWSFTKQESWVDLVSDLQHTNQLCWRPFFLHIIYTQEICFLRVRRRMLPWHFFFTLSHLDEINEKKHHKDPQGQSHLEVWQSLSLSDG